ncbi:MAG TPA: hypothetical protein VFL14_02800 [Xanthomonadales bacterium]|nr:hypothetical protein [Xanthomonadales bacterium]
MSATAPDTARLVAAVRAVHAYSRARGWKGSEKHDALNSPLLRTLFGWHRWTRLLAIQGVMRFPLNLRPLLLVPPAHNPKGVALFAQSMLDMAALSRADADRDEARRLLELLLEIAVPTPCGARAWGYLYPWQDLGFFAPSGTPNAVVSAFACEALLDGHEQLGDARWLAPVGDAVRFFLGDLRVLKDEPEELCLAYMPLPMTMRVMDVSILVAAVLARYARHTGRSELLDPAARLVRYVVRRQTDAGAWWYTDPPGDSPIGHDNYHTGFILDALWRWMAATGDRQYEDAYYRGLRFYAERLFMPDGAPRWMSDREFPYDVHGAAQGILTFARHEAEYPGFADRVAGWALAHLYDPEGRFYYQRTRRYTKRFTFMRWCNGWMARALAHLARTRGT